MNSKDISVTDSSSDSDSASESSSSDESSSDSRSSGSSSSSNSESESHSDTTVSPTKSDKYSGTSESTSLSDTDDDDDDESPYKKTTRKDVAKIALEKPDLYGIRRSGRQRKEPSRLTVGEEKEDGGQRGRRTRRKSSGDWHQDSDDTDKSSSSSASEFEGSRPVRQTRRGNRRAVKTRGRPARGAGRRKRKRYTSDSDSDSTPERRTTSSRSAAHNKIRHKRPKSQRKSTKKKVSYKETSADEHTDEDDVLEWVQPEKEEPSTETIEKILNTRCARETACGSKTTMYNVEDDGDPNKGFDPDTESSVVQYLVKWKNFAHIHNTWESEADLFKQKVNGMKKLENFKNFGKQLEEWKRNASPEDVEYWLYQKQMADALANAHLLVERIVAHQASKDSDGKTNVFPDYLVKWRGLPYCDCTWEAGELIQRFFHEALEEYNARNRSQCIPTQAKYCKVLRQRPKFQTLKEQPDFLGNEDLRLRDYQLDGLNWLVSSWCKEHSVILADEMGLGKTIQIISFISNLMYTYSLYGPFLIVVPLSTIVSWQREFQLWAPAINAVVYLGDINSRNRIREHEWCHPGNKRLKFNVIITTYEILLKDKAFLGGVNWALLAVDEAHRLKNDDSLLYKTLIDFKTNHRVLITGTPLQNSLKELWSLLHFIMPNLFDNWLDFQEKHNNSQKTGFSSLHKQLEPFLLRRMKKDVEKSLPSKTEQILRVEMTKQQKQYYRWILTKNYKALSKGVKGSISGFLNIVMELKKCCNHCFLTRTPEEEEQHAKDPLEAIVKSSGKMILLDKLLVRLRDTGHRVLIFSQMVRLLDILAEYMKLRHFQFQRLDGSVQGEQRKQAMDHFNAEGSQDFCFLLSTRAGGLGVNLASADTVIIFDSDWNPQNDLQAMARAHRIGQKKQVSVYRLVTKGSVEEDIVERAKQKMVLDHLVIQRMDTTGRTVLNKGMNSSGSNPFNKQELACILKFGAEELFKENEEEEGELQVDIDEILKRAETTHTEAHNTATDDLLSNFKVVSFDNLEDEELEGRENHEDAGKLWDNIIPEKDRQRVEDEERARELSELNLGPRQRKQVTQFNAYDSEDERSTKHKKKSYPDDESSDSESDDGGGGVGSRKKGGRGAAQRGSKSRVLGFTTIEIRKFIKSYRKFPRPMERLEDISGDAELQEKSHADLQRLGLFVQEQCEKAIKDYEKQQEQENEENNPALAAVDSAGKKAQRGRGPTANIGSVVVNAKQILQSAHDLEPLARVIPADAEKRKQYQLNSKVKFVNWDCLWEKEDDSNLLKGIYEYGMGSWEAIKMDPNLNLHDKILPDGKLKPQVSHISTRAEYLIKVLRKDLDMPDDTKPVIKPPRSSRPKKTKVNPRVKSAELVVDDPLSDDSSDDNIMGDVVDKRDRMDVSHTKQSSVTTTGENKTSTATKPEKAKKPNKEVHDKKAKKDTKVDKKPRKTKQESSILKYVDTSEPVALDGNGQPIVELAPDVFGQCKDKMRPVKKSLKQLDKPDNNLNESDQLEHMRQCLLTIGDHIALTLSEVDKASGKHAVTSWRNHLWIFVSKFTEFDANKLYKVYRRALKKREESHKKPNSKSKGHHHQHSHSSSTHNSASKLKKRTSNDNTTNNATGDSSTHTKHKPHHTSSSSATQPHRHKTNHDHYTDGSSQESWNNSGPRGGGSGTASGGANSTGGNHGGSGAPGVANDMWQHMSPLDRAQAQRESNNAFKNWSQYDGHNAGNKHFNKSQHRAPYVKNKFLNKHRNERGGVDGGYGGGGRYNKPHHGRDHAGGSGAGSGSIRDHQVSGGPYGGPTAGGGYRHHEQPHGGPPAQHWDRDDYRESWHDDRYGNAGHQGGGYNRKRSHDPHDKRDSRPSKDPRIHSWSGPQSGGGRGRGGGIGHRDEHSMEYEYYGVGVSDVHSQDSSYSDPRLSRVSHTSQQSASPAQH